MESASVKSLQKNITDWSWTDLSTKIEKILRPNQLSQHTFCKEPIKWKVPVDVWPLILNWYFLRMNFVFVLCLLCQQVLWSSLEGNASTFFVKIEYRNRICHLQCHQNEFGEDIRILVVLAMLKRSKDTPSAPVFTVFFNNVLKTLRWIIHVDIMVWWLLFLKLVFV